MTSETQSSGQLFGKPAEGQEPERGDAAKRGAARVLRPNRKQLEFRASDLESLLSEGHRAQVV